MAGLGIADEHVLEETQGWPEQTAATQTVTISYNQTEPNLIRDGIDAIAVTGRADETYRVQYWGYIAGGLVVTAAGIKELGRSLFANADPIPQWVLDDEVAADPPWWVPDEYEQPTEVCCDECNSEVAVTEILTPEREHRDRQLCPDCYY